MKAKRAAPKAKRTTIEWVELQRLCFVNSAQIPKALDIGGRRYVWVGIGLIHEGPADGTETLVNGKAPEPMFKK